MGSMNTTDDVYSQEQINDVLGKKISEVIFYNLCTIKVIGDCKNCNIDQDNASCNNCKKLPHKKMGQCPIITPRHGFQQKFIPLSGDIFIVFMYPLVSEKIFEKIFIQHSELIKERFGNLIAINNKNDLLRRSRAELQRQVTYDEETGLLNATKLNEHIR